MNDCFSGGVHWLVWIDMMAERSWWEGGGRGEREGGRGRERWIEGGREGERERGRERT